MQNFPMRSSWRPRRQLSVALIVGAALLVAGCTDTSSGPSETIATADTAVSETIDSNGSDTTPGSNSLPGDSGGQVASTPDATTSTSVVATTIEPTTIETSTVPSTTLAPGDFVVPRETLVSDVASADLVAIVRLSNPEIVEETIPTGTVATVPPSSTDSAASTVPATRLKCGYVFVKADATIVEIIKGSAEVGATIKVGWFIECPLDLAVFFPGDRLLFANAVDRPNVEVAWEAIENTTIEATESNVAVLRSVVIPG